MSDSTPSEVLWSFDLQEGLQHLPEEYKAEVQIRKAGETRYGKGEIEITEDLVRLRYKKFMSKKQEVTLSRSDIEKAEFQNRELPIEIVGPGFFWDQGWITLELVMRDGEGYTLYVGQPGNLPAGKVGPYLEKFMTIYLMLNGDRPCPTNRGKSVRKRRTAQPRVHRTQAPNTRSNAPSAEPLSRNPGYASSARSKTSHTTWAAS